MSNYDENVSYIQGSDTGNNDSASIAPVQNGESLWQLQLDRPGENLRIRTETLRQAVQNLNYYADYDRALLLRSDATFTMSAGGGPWTLAQVGDDLWLYPALTPGRSSGGRYLGGRVWVAGLPYSGTLGVNDLTLTASSAHTGQRGYADGQSFDAPGGANVLTLGANGIIVNLVADGTLATGVVHFAIAGTPKRVITITYGTNGGSTTVGQLITAINGDTTSQGTYGVAHFLFASTTGIVGNAPTPFTNGLVQGAYDSEAHQVTAAQMTAFFGIGANALNEGESLCLGYPAGPVDTSVPAPKGGRRQSIWDLPTDRVGGDVQNTTPAAGYMLFNSGREPEKIPGSIPIGKVINGKFVFADGCTVLIPGAAAVSLTESTAMYARLALHAPAGTEGSDLVGYGTTDVWNPDSGDGIVATTVRGALDEIITKLAAEAASNSGSRRLGAEAITGTSSVGNNALSPVAGSIRQQLSQMLSQAGATNAPGGINERVSEFGHRMHGRLPVYKNIGESVPENISGGGGRTLHVELHAPLTSTLAANHNLEPSSVHARPMYWNNGGNDFLNSIESGQNVAQDVPYAIPIGALIAARATFIRNRIITGLNIARTTGSFDSTVLAYVYDNTSGNPIGDGWYYLDDINTGTQQFYFHNLDGSHPTFVAGPTLANLRVKLYETVKVGSDRDGTSASVFQAGPAPVAVICRTAPTDRVVDIFDSTTYAATFLPTTQIFAKHAIFDAQGTTPRDTDHIHGTLDFNQLKGNESAAPVDASGYSGLAGSHHHGSHYTQLVDIHPTAVGTRIFNNTLGAVATIAPGTNVPGLALAGGEVAQGMIVTYSILITPTGAGNTVFGLEFYDTLDHDLYEIVLFRYTATGGGDTMTLAGTIWLPVSTNAFHLITNFTNSNVNINNGATAITIYQTGKIVGHV